MFYTTHLYQNWSWFTFVLLTLVDSSRTSEQNTSTVCTWFGCSHKTVGLTKCANVVKPRGNHMRIVYTTHLWSYWVCFRMRKLPVERSRIGRIQASPKKKWWPRVVSLWDIPHPVGGSESGGFTQTESIWKTDKASNQFCPAWTIGDWTISAKNPRQKQGLKILDLFS